MRPLLHTVPAGLALTAGCALPPTGTQAPPVSEMAVDGARLPYVEQGTGTPVVMVHAALVDRRMWEPMRAAIAAKRRYVAFDQRYFGSTAWPDGGDKFGGETQVADLAAFVRG